LHDPFRDMAGLLKGEMQKHTSAAVAGLGAELGTITESGLKLDSFAHEITDFLIASFPSSITLPEFSLIGTMTPEGGVPSQPMTFDFEETVIEDVEMNIEEDLEPGDRVLVLSVNGGRDPVVICKVVDLSG